MAQVPEPKFGWINHFHTTRPLPGLARFIVVAREHRQNPQYYWDGRDRNGQRDISFQYTLRGHGKIIYRGEEQLIWPGSGFLFRIGDPDLIYCYPEGATESWQFLYVTISDEAGALVDAINNRWGIVHQLDMHKGVIQTYLKYETQGRSDHNISASQSSDMVHDLLNSIMRRHEIGEGRRKESHVVRQAQVLLSDRLGEGLNASDMASELKVSREHLTRLFKSELGISPYQYILQERINLATHLLKTTTLTCAEVGTRCGFDTASQFNKAFKQFYPITPRVYRQQSGVS